MPVRPQRTAICAVTFRKPLSCSYTVYFGTSSEPPLDDHSGMQHGDRSATNPFNTSPTMRTMLRTMVCTLYHAAPRCLLVFLTKCCPLTVSIAVTICCRKSGSHVKVRWTRSYSRLFHMFALPVSSLVMPLVRKPLPDNYRSPV